MNFAKLLFVKIENVIIFFKRKVENSLVTLTQETLKNRKTSQNEQKQKKKYRLIECVTLFSKRFLYNIYDINIGD